MEYEIQHRPSYAMAQISLEPGEQLQAETATMISMSDTIHMKTGLPGGLFNALRRSTLGLSTFFLNTYTANAPGEINLAPHMPGDIEALVLNDQTIYVQSGSFLAATMDIAVDSRWGGARTFFTSEGLFLLRCSGTGTLFLSSYGAIHRVDLDRDEHYSVDNGHMVAFDQSVRYNIGKAGNWLTTLLGGEGIVCKIEGPGRFYIQSRSEETFLQWIVIRLGRRFRRK